MKPLTEPEIRASFVNCSKGESQRLYVPRALAEQPWADLDYLGWRDPKAPARACLVTDVGGRTQGVVLRLPTPGTGTMRRSMCLICATTHDGGVALMVAAKTGKAGKQGDTIGTYFCADLSCSLYVRNLKQTDIKIPDSLPVEDRIARLRASLSTFISALA